MKTLIWLYPGILSLQLCGVGRHLAVVVGQLGEVRGGNLVLPSDAALPIAEELHVGPGNRLAGDRVRDEVPRLAVELLLDDDRIADPDDDSADIALVHFRRQQIRPGLLQRRRDGDPLVEVLAVRFELEIPAGDDVAQVLRLIVLNQLIADVADLHAIVIESFWTRFEILLDVLQQLLGLDRLGFEVHLASIAETEVERGPRAGGVDPRPLEPRPVANDLLDPFGPALVAAGPVLGDGLIPAASRLGILPAVLGDLRQLIESPFAVGRLAGSRHLLKDLYVVEFVGKRQPFDAGGQFADRFFVTERVQRVGAALVLLFITDRLSAEEKAVRLHRLYAELRLQELSEQRTNFIGAGGGGCGCLFEHRPPALSVVPGLFELSRYLVEDGVAVRIDRRPGAAAARAAEAVPRGLVVVGQHRQIRQHLQLPGFVVLPTVGQETGEIEIERSDPRRIGVADDERGSLLHQLQRPHAVALETADIAPAAPPISALKLARDDEPMAGPFDVRLGGGLQQTPIARVYANDLLAKRVDFRRPAQAVQAGDPVAEILPDKFGVVPRIEGQGPKPRFRLAEVALFHLLQSQGSALRLGFLNRGDEHRDQTH